MGWIPTLIFADEDGLLPQSRDGKSPNRYFPELLEALAPLLEKPCVLDGEMVIVGSPGLISRLCCSASIQPSRAWEALRDSSAKSLLTTCREIDFATPRHATQFVRWRPDKSAKKCRYDQLEVTRRRSLKKCSG